MNMLNINVLLLQFYIHVILVLYVHICNPRGEISN